VIIHASIPQRTTEPRTTNCRPGKRLGDQPPLEGCQARLLRSRRGAPAWQLPIEHTLAKRGAEKLWDKVNGGAKKGYVNAFGAISAGQAMQQAKAGLEAVYLSGWQVAADGNTSETMYPDQSLYAYDSVPTMVRRINNTFKRADEIQWGRGIKPGDKEFIDYFLPIVADAEAGFGGVLNAFELMKNMIQPQALLAFTSKTNWLP
jgi:isocitrate lyase